MIGAYDAQIVRWDGPLDDFHYIMGSSSAPTINDGDIMEAEIIGGHIKLWHNGDLITEADDSTWTDGNPGIGTFDGGTAEQQEQYGFKDFQAWEL
jgi:hypothetical protein